MSKEMRHLIKDDHAASHKPPKYSRFQGFSAIAVLLSKTKKTLQRPTKKGPDDVDLQAKRHVECHEWGNQFRVTHH